MYSGQDSSVDDGVWWDVLAMWRVLVDAVMEGH